MLTPGATFGKYRIEEIIGSGAMGVVYRAVCLEDSSEVALKLIDEKFSSSESYRKRFKDEASAAAKIDSDNVVKVREFAEHDNHHYMALEFIEGEDLRNCHDRLDFKTKIDIICQICRGLKAAHDKDLIHRDLKPENVRITSDNKAKILDFGLAKTINADSVDQYGNIEGTLYYLAPEQLTNDKLSYGTDLFSLGIIMYELFTGRRPFEGEYPAAIIYSILHEEPSFPSQIDDSIPGWLDEMIVKLLTKNVLDRYQTVEEVLEQIERGLRADSEPSGKITASQTVTVVDLRNLSGDDSWEYFCQGFTDDLITELSKRTDLIISAEPSSIYSRNIKEVFKRCRSDYVISGSILKWREKIRLNLTIYGDNGENLISGQNYESDAEDIFNVLSQAVEECSAKLEEVSGVHTIDVDEYFKTDINAYDYYLKGKNYYHTNKPEDLKFAEQMFEKALEIDPKLAYAHSGLSDVYAFQYMAYYDRSKSKLELAEEEARKAIEISPHLPEAHRSLGRFYMFLGEFGRAEESFKRAIKYNPKYAIGYRTLAWLKEIQGEHEEAIDWAKQTLKYAPNDVETLLLLGLINMDQRKYTVAMATLHRAIELAPDYGRGYFNLGTVYLKLGVLDVALENFENAIKYEGDPSAYNFSGYIHMIQRRYDKARKMYEDSIEHDYFPFISYYLLGLTEKLTGDDEKAAKYFNLAVETALKCEVQDKTDPYCRVYKGLSLVSLGKKDEAERIFRALEKTESDNGEIMHDVARGYALLGYIEDAYDLITRAFSIHAGPTEKEAITDPHFAAIVDRFEKEAATY